MTTIAFKNVGRGKKSWTAEIDTTQHPDVVGHDLYLQVRANGGLASRNVEVIYDEETFEGSIAAGFHQVGTFGPEAT